MEQDIANVETVETSKDETVKAKKTDRPTLPFLSPTTTVAEKRK